MKMTKPSSRTTRPHKNLTSSRARQRVAKAWILSLFAHGCLMVVISVVIATEWSNAPSSSFAWKVQLVEAPPVQPQEEIPPPEQEVPKGVIEAAPPPQPVAQIKRGTEHHLRKRKTLAVTPGPVQSESVRPHSRHTSSAQPPTPRQTAVPTPLPSFKKKTQASPDFIASLPSHSAPSETHFQKMTYPDTTHSQSHVTTGQTSWKEGLQQSTERNREFSVNGKKAFALEANPQLLHEAPVRAPQPQKEDFGWLTDAVHQKIKGLKRYPHRARVGKMEGQVVLRATIKRSGTLEALEIDSPSGHQLLDQDALETVKRAFPLNLPSTFHRTQVVLLLPITYALKTF